MDIYITEIKSGRKIQIPVVPQEIQSGADARFAQYDIMKRGEVRVSEGRYLIPVSWEGIFPGELRKGEPWVRKWTDPKELSEIFTQWRDNGELLKLVITDTNINMDCKVASYKPSESGGYGDISYSVSFIEHVDMVVVTTKNASGITGSSSSSSSGSGTAKTHTVKSGDCLWNIAQKYLGKGSRWGEIYNANKEIIENEAKRRGKASSNNGSLIWPGTVLSIPGAGGSGGSGGSKLNTSKLEQVLCKIEITGNESYRGTISVAYDSNGKGVASTGNKNSFSFSCDKGSTIMVTILSANGHSYNVTKMTGAWTNNNATNIYSLKNVSGNCGLLINWVK